MKPFYSEPSKLLEKHFRFLLTDPSFKILESTTFYVRAEYRVLMFAFGLDRGDFVVEFTGRDDIQWGTDLAGFLFWAKWNDIVEEGLYVKNTPASAAKALKLCLPLILDLFSPEKYRETKKAIRSFL